ncbi:hypothetical protein D3C71_1498710 [compost metagenome]
MTAFIVVTFQNRRGEEHLAQDITQTRGDTLATLQAAAQNGHRHVRQQRQVRAQTVQMLVITFSCITRRRGAGKTARQAQPEAAHFVAADVADVFEQQFIERIHIVVLCRSHLFQHIRMAANRALTKDHHATGQNVCAFHGDGNRCALIAARQEVAFAEHNAFTASNIHCINN